MFARFHSFAFILFSFLLSFALAEIVRRISIRSGFTSKPKSSRWSDRVVALGGGIAIHLTILMGLIYFGGVFLTSLLPAYLMVFILGVLDDFLGISPYVKLLGQTIAATYLVSQGFVLPLGLGLVAIPVSLLWLVGLSNAVNLIDNMDGLAAGISAIAAMGFSYLLHQQGQNELAQVGLLVAASSLGFLVLNFHPARIFMGDAGSLPLGLLLAAMATRVRLSEPISQSLSIIPGLLLLIVPIFDTILVMTGRGNANQPLMSGGRDHSSHRFVSLGLSDKRAVLVLYAIGGIGFWAACLAVEAGPVFLFVLTTSAVVLSTLLALFLLDIPVYRDETVPDKVILKPLGLPIRVLYIIELGLDIGVFCLSWNLGHFLRFQETGFHQGYIQASMNSVLPYLITAKLVAFAVFRLYRGLWKSVSLRDVYQVFKASTLATLLVIALSALLTRLTDISRMVLILDWCLTFLGTVGVRAALSAFRRWSRKLSVSPYRAAFLGPPNLGSAVSEALRQEGNMDFAGIITTDTNASSTGEGVLGASTNIEKIVLDNQIDTLIVFSEEDRPALSKLASQGVLIRSLKFNFS